jgi:hypothetical protein
MIAVYVDDCGITTSDQKHINALITGLRSRGFTLHIKGEFEEFLGIGINRGPDCIRCIHMTQKGLIKKVIHYLPLEANIFSGGASSNCNMLNISFLG